MIASALHLGFQAVVTLVVYPALADLPASGWAAGHDAHSRRITVVVAPLYATVAAACAWVLVAGPRSVPLLLAVAGNAVAAVATAVVAAPAHGRLGREGPQPALLQRLLVADRVRLVAAACALAAALVA